MARKNLHIFVCLLLNWYSFVKSQPNFIFFLAESRTYSTLLVNWSVQFCVIDTIQLFANIILEQISSWDSTENEQYYFYTVVWKRAIGAVDSICIVVLLGIYSGESLPKIIKFGWDFTKPYQFKSSKWKYADFLGRPVYGWTSETTILSYLYY